MRRRGKEKDRVNSRGSSRGRFTCAAFNLSCCSRLALSGIKPFKIFPPEGRITAEMTTLGADDITKDQNCLAI
jgi:hypothetical protein